MGRKGDTGEGQEARPVGRGFPTLCPSCPSLSLLFEREKQARQGTPRSSCTRAVRRKVGGPGRDRRDTLLCEVSRSRVPRASAGLRRCPSLARSGVPPLWVRTLRLLWLPEANRPRASPGRPWPSRPPLFLGTRGHHLLLPATALAAPVRVVAATVRPDLS
jgi:hypothetical protein